MVGVERVVAIPAKVEAAHMTATAGPGTFAGVIHLIVHAEFEAVIPLYPTQIV